MEMFIGGTIQKKLSRLQEADEISMDALRALFKNKYVQIKPDVMSAEPCRLKK